MEYADDVHPQEHIVAIWLIRKTCHGYQVTHEKVLSLWIWAVFGITYRNVDSSAILKRADRLARSYG